MQLLIDTSSSADGLGTLYFMNLTQGDLGWTQINDTPVNMGLTSRYTGTYAAMQNPANWDTMMIVRAADVGLQVDNLVPNAVPVPEPAALVLAVLGLMGLVLVRRRR
jgi:hypothetical protein